MTIQKVLIANRGEIACRIIRACHLKGIKTVAVFSDADKDFPFVSMADQAIPLGGSSVTESYLNVEKILKAAQDSAADAIHPGYGLLSENADFAKRVEEHNLLWIGPSPEVIAAMGDKLVARSEMIAAGVQVVPGSGSLDGPLHAQAEADQIGYPVMLKASCGGGGIGLHICKNASELEKFYVSEQGRAQAYFGDGTLFIEKWIRPARHIEVQIIADSLGNVCHLYERECSVQRRNQKVIEESLSPSISDFTRRQMYEAAIAAAKRVNYVGVGTVEFIVNEDNNFYFLEMNTRLQVEHAVTEAITGLDIVGLQIDLAEGKQLPFKQIDVNHFGHAIEFRLYAEDPDTFYPSPGQVIKYRCPEEKGVRIDSGIMEGNVVSPYYDPMIAKCIIHCKDRLETINKSKLVLQQFVIEGIKTNIPRLLMILDDPAFRLGQYHTQIIAKS